MKLKTSAYFKIEENIDKFKNEQCIILVLSHYKYNLF